MARVKPGCACRPSALRNLPPEPQFSANCLYPLGRWNSRIVLSLHQQPTPAHFQYISREPGANQEFPHLEIALAAAGSIPPYRPAPIPRPAALASPGAAPPAQRKSRRKCASTASKKQQGPSREAGPSLINSGNALLSHTLARAVPSGLRGLTSVFGMGTGVTPSLQSPKTCRGGRFRPPLNIDGATDPCYAKSEFYGQAERVISSGRLHTLLCFHPRPINLVVFQDPS